LFMWVIASWSKKRAQRKKTMISQGRLQYFYRRIITRIEHLKIVSVVIGCSPWGKSSVRKGKISFPKRAIFGKYSGNISLTRSLRFSLFN
jgi:hypothetical protein